MESLQLKPGEVIYKCPKCCCVKPERAHHCRYGLCPRQSQAVPVVPWEFANSAGDELDNSQRK